MSFIETEYENRMESLSGTQRVARSMGMLRWTREMIARQIVSEVGEISDEQLKWRVALRLYESDEAICEMIRQRLRDVSD